MYESRIQKPLPRLQFFQRLLGHLMLALLLLFGSLAIGMTGYHAFEQLSWIDSFLNASMLLGGMGPVNPPVTNAGKLFAGGYALYCGLVFIATAAIIATPLLHRFMHFLHWTDKG